MRPSAFGDRFADDGQRREELLPYAAQNVLTTRLSNDRGIGMASDQRALEADRPERFLDLAEDAQRMRGPWEFRYDRPRCSVRDRRTHVLAVELVRFHTRFPLSVRDWRASQLARATS